MSGRVELNGVGEGRRLGALAHRTRHAQSSGHFGVEGGHGLVEGPTRGIARHLVQSAYKGTGIKHHGHSPRVSVVVGEAIFLRLRLHSRRNDGHVAVPQPVGKVWIADNLHCGVLGVDKAKEEFF